MMQALNESGKFWEAVQAASCAVTHRHDFPDAYVTLGRAQLNLGEVSVSRHAAAASC